MIAAEHTVRTEDIVRTGNTAQIMRTAPTTVKDRSTAQECSMAEADTAERAELVLISDKQP